MITADQFCHVANPVNSGWLQMYLSWFYSIIRLQGCISGHCIQSQSHYIVLLVDDVSWLCCGFDVTKPHSSQKFAGVFSRCGHCKTLSVPYVFWINVFNSFFEDSIASPQLHVMKSKEHCAEGEYYYSIIIIAYVCLCVCVSLPLRPIITTHMKWSCIIQFNKLYNVSVSLYGTCHQFCVKRYIFFRKCDW